MQLLDCIHVKEVPSNNNKNKNKKCTHIIQCLLNNNIKTIIWLVIFYEQK